MKKYRNIYYVYVREQNKKRANWYKTFTNLSDAEEEANYIYTGKQEITIRQAWQAEKGRTGEDIVSIYKII